MSDQILMVSVPTDTVREYHDGMLGLPHLKVLSCGHPQKLAYIALVRDESVKCVQKCTKSL